MSTAGQNGNAVLLIKRARVGKVAGVLSVAPRTLSWSPSDPASGQDAIEVAVSTIQKQQRAKGKSFLRLVTLGKPVILEFDSEADVGTVVDTLGPLLSVPHAKPAQGGAPDSQAELKRSLLAEDRDLAALHEQLVGRGVLTEDEFWKGRGSLLSKGVLTVQQRVGLSSAMLADMQPSADGKSDTVKIKLTPAMVHQIFAEKPAVKRAYQANVPTRMMTGQAFWAKYLKHQLLQQSARQREAAHLPPEPAFAEGEEFFGRYQRDEDDVARAAAAARRNPTDDLAADENDDMGTGYGVWHSSRKDPQQQQQQAGGGGGGGRRGSLIRDINRHAAVVMDGMPASLPADASDAAALLAAEQPVKKADSAAQLSSERDDVDGAGQGGYSGSGLDDLRPREEPHYPELRIQDPRGAFDVAAGDMSADAAADTVAAEVAGREALQALRSIDPAQLDVSLPDGLALQVLMAAMQESKGTGGGGGAQESLISLQLDRLRQLVLAANELLRHFWACFPAANAQRQAKAQRIAGALQSHYERLEDAENASSGPERTHIRRLLRPVKEALDAALAKQAGDNTQPAHADGLASIPLSRH